MTHETACDTQVAGQSEGTVGPLLTRRCRLRPFRPDDVDAALEYLGDPAVMEFIEPVFDRGQASAFIQTAGVGPAPLVGDCDPANLASIRVMEKAGMTRAPELDDGLPVDDRALPPRCCRSGDRPRRTALAGSNPDGYHDLRISPAAAPPRAARVALDPAAP